MPQGAATGSLPGSFKVVLRSGIPEGTVPSAQQFCVSSVQLPDSLWAPRRQESRLTLPSEPRSMPPQTQPTNSMKEKGGQQLTGLVNSRIQTVRLSDQDKLPLPLKCQALRPKHYVLLLSQVSTLDKMTYHLYRCIHALRRSTVKSQNLLMTMISFFS